MPLNRNYFGVVPARMRRARVLIVGCGDVGLRAARLLLPRVRVLALSSSAAGQARLRAQGLCALVGNLDQPTSLRRLGALAPRVLYLAPPPAHGVEDSRSRALLAALQVRALPQRLVYASTSGVYGDCAGAWVDETRATHPESTRAQRRVSAEQQWRAAGRRRRWRQAGCLAGPAAMAVSVLRVPGMYAPDRPRGTPRERLLEGLPALRAQDDVYTSHIHSDDLARACVAALWRGRPQRVYNVCDDTELTMGDYLELAADLLGLPPPQRLARAEVQARVSPERMRFLQESRRLRNGRMKRELRLRLRYPTVRQGLL